jgi:hypothetical protein
MNPISLDKISFVGCQGVDIFCSSPFYVRHALTIASRSPTTAPVTYWYQCGGPLEHLFQLVAARTDMRTKCWQDTPLGYRLSRPGSHYKVRRKLARQLVSGNFSFRGHCVFYEGDYPEPSLHSIIASLSRRNQIYRFADEGHNVRPAANINLRGLLRLMSDRLAFGFRMKPRVEYGHKNHYLHFFDSSFYGVRPLSLIPDDTSLTPLLIPITAPHRRPLLILLESTREEMTCHQYRRTLERLVAGLEKRGWSIIAKGHPRLGNSQAIDDMGVPKLDQQVPLEMFDLSQVRAVFGLCSSGMISSAVAGIPTFSVEPLFSRIDSTKAAWSMNFLQTHPAWDGGKPRLMFISEWNQLPDAMI